MRARAIPVALLLGVGLLASPAAATETAPQADSAGDPVRIASRVVIGTVEVAQGPAADRADRGTDGGADGSDREVVAVTWQGGVPEFSVLRVPAAGDVQRVIAALAGEGVHAGPNSRVRLEELHAATPDDNPEPRSYQQDNLDAIQAPAAWKLSQGAGTTVAVVDTGVDATVFELAGRVLPAIDLTDKPAAGDPQGHGTKVSTLLAAGIDGRGIAGVAPKVRILPIRVLDETGSGDTADVAEGIKRATLAGAKIINASLGGSDDSAAVRAAAEFARSRGALVVAAVGNDGDQAPVEFPAAAPAVLGVASVSYEPESGGFSRSYFSNIGPEVDIAAPGEGVPATGVGGATSSMSGTSAATPHVSAVAALVSAANPTLSGEQIADLLMQTAEDGESPGPDTYVGSGLVRADLAVEAAAALPGGVRGPSAVHRVGALTLRASGAPITARPRAGTLITFSALSSTQGRDGGWVPTPAGTPFSLQFKASGTSAWRTVAQGKAAAGGKLSARGRVIAEGSWRFLVQSTRGLPLVISVRPPSGVSWQGLSSGSVSIRSGRTTTLSGRATLSFRTPGASTTTLPAAPGMSFDVQFRPQVGSWRTVSTGTIQTAGRLTARISPTSDGRWRFRIGSRTSPSIYIDTYRR